MAAALKKKTGEVLVEAGLVTEDQLQVALIEQKKTGKKLVETLISLGFMDEGRARELIGDVIGIKFVDVSKVVPDPDALAVIDEKIARSLVILPYSYDGKMLKVVMSEPDNIVLLDKIKRIVGKDIVIEPVGASSEDIKVTIDRYYGYSLSFDEVIRELSSGNFNDEDIQDEGEYEHPVVRLVNIILTDAVKKNASDIHFEPEERYVRIRYRIDGVLHQIKVIHADFWKAIGVRLKVISNLDITETRSPQDGRMEMTIGGRSIFFRVSTLPTMYGENVVLRILDKERGVVPFEKLDMDDTSRKNVEIMIKRPTGIMLVTGPTGSGKTTTLYSILNEKNSEDVNIMTLEDPVEYPMELIRQTQVNEEVGMTFASGVRSLLRQDPDIILVGEIRDSETAEMALRAAMTGHQVFATLHTNSAIGAIPRLIDIGVSPSIMAGNIIGIIAQRLVRKLCKYCKIKRKVKEEEAIFLGVDNEFEIYESCGCEKCSNTGYSGRVALMEALRFTPEMDEILLDGKDWKQIEHVARGSGFKTLADSAVYWILKGETTLNEASRVVDLAPIIGSVKRIGSEIR